LTVLEIPADFLKSVEMEPFSPVIRI